MFSVFNIVKDRLNMCETVLRNTDKWIPKKIRMAIVSSLLEERRARLKEEANIFYTLFILIGFSKIHMN